MPMELHVSCMDPKCHKCNPRWSPQPRPLVAAKPVAKKSKEAREVPYKHLLKVLAYAKQHKGSKSNNSSYSKALKVAEEALNDLKKYW